jgi:GT2 family glycosyltransferase
MFGSGKFLRLSNGGFALEPESYLYFPVEAKKYATYRCKISAVNLYGNGRLYFNICMNDVNFAQQHLNCHDIWKEYHIDITTGKLANISDFVFCKIFRAPGCTGKVLLEKDVCIELLPSGCDPKPDVLVYNKNFDIPFCYDVVEDGIMEEFDQQLWRGYGLVSKKDVLGIKCQSMDGDKATIFIPVKIESNCLYRVHVDVKKETGNGKLFCNFYANRNFDFSHVSLHCDVDNWSTFDFQLCSGKFPQTLPIVLRLWRTPGGTGSLLIRRIALEKLPENTQLEEPKIIIASQNYIPSISAPLIKKIIDVPSKKLEQIGIIPSTPPFLSSKEQVKNNQNYSSYGRKQTKLLFLSELNDEELEYNAFNEIGINICAEKLDDLSKIIDLIKSFNPCWIHIHMSRNTKLNIGILDEIRKTNITVLITSWLESGFPFFIDKLLPILQKMDVTFFESEMEVSIWKSSGCITAQLWDPGCDCQTFINPSDVALLGDSNSSIYIDLLKTCNQFFNCQHVNMQNGAKVIIFTDTWPSKDLLTLLSSGSTVFAKKTIPLSELCYSKNLIFFENLEDSIEEIKKNIEKVQVNYESIINMHSRFERAKEITTKMYFAESFKHNTFISNICCVSNYIPFEFRKRSKKNFIILPFSEVLESKILRLRPQVLHIYLDDADIDTPWVDFLIDLRRKLPYTYIILWNSGNSPLLSELKFYVDQIFVPYENINLCYNKLIWHVEGHDCHLNNFNEFERDINHMVESFLNKEKTKECFDMTVFIGTYNRIEHLKNSVASVLKSIGDKKVEIIINDAGSSDGTQEWMKEQEINKNIILLFSNKLTSFTHAFNESLQIARGKYIVWLSDDIMTEGNSLRDMCYLMKTLSPLDMAGFSIRNSWSKDYIVRKDAGYYSPTVGCMYTDTLKRMGGFNTDYMHYAQDSDLDMRVLRLGGKIISANNCKLLHNCQNDELRKNNNMKHLQNKGDAKFNLVHCVETLSDYVYPKILIISKDNNIYNLIQNIKKQYRNCYIFTTTNLIQKNYLSQSVIINDFIYRFYDLIIECKDNENILIEPKSKSPFITLLLKQ